MHHFITCHNGHVLRGFAPATDTMLEVALWTATLFDATGEKVGFFVLEDRPGAMAEFLGYMTLLDNVTGIEVSYIGEKNARVASENA